MEWRQKWHEILRVHYREKSPGVEVSFGINSEPLIEWKLLFEELCQSMIWHEILGGNRHSVGECTNLCMLLIVEEELEREF